MTAALFAARAGKQVTLIDGNPTVGRKLLVTGGGRCNLTNTASADALLAAFGRQGQPHETAIGSRLAQGIGHLLHRALRPVPRNRQAAQVAQPAAEQQVAHWPVQDDHPCDDAEAQLEPRREQLQRIDRGDENQRRGHAVESGALAAEDHRQADRAGHFLGKTDRCSICRRGPGA